MGCRRWITKIIDYIFLHGELRDENGDKLPALELLSTKYLPSLSGKAWNKPDDKK